MNAPLDDYDCMDLFLDPNDENDTTIPEGIEHVFVSRLEHGHHVRIPRRFTVEEMHSSDQLAALFGGGDYRIDLRQGPRMARLKTIKSYRIAGTPRSLDSTEPARATQPQQAAPIAQQMPQAVHPAEHRDLAMIALTMVSKSQENMAQMFTAMATSARADARAQVDSIRAESRASVEMMGKYFEGVASMKKQENAAGSPEQLLGVITEAMGAGMDIANSTKANSSSLENLAEGFLSNIAAQQTKANGVASGQVVDVESKPA